MLMSNTVTHCGSDRLDNAQSNEPRETHGGQQKQKKEKDTVWGEKCSVILHFIDFKPSNKNRRQSFLFTGSVAIAQKSLKQWEVNGKGIIPVFYVSFLPLSFMSPEKACTVFKMQHKFKKLQHLCIYVSADAQTSTKTTRTTRHVLKRLNQLATL